MSSRNGASRAGMKDSLRVGVRTVQYAFLSVSSGFNAIGFPIQALALGDVAAGIAHGFSVYRVHSLRVRIHPPTWIEQRDTDFAYNVGVCYSGGHALSTAPGGFDSMAQFSVFKMSGAFDKTLDISVPSNIMLGEEPLRWWDVTNRSGPPQEDIDQGYVYVGYWTQFTQDTTARVWIELDADIEFAQRVETTDTLSKPDREVVYKRSTVSDDEKYLDSIDSESLASEATVVVHPLSRSTAPAVAAPRVATTLLYRPPPLRRESNVSDYTVVRGPEALKSRNQEG